MRYWSGEVVELRLEEESVQARRRLRAGVGSSEMLLDSCPCCLLV